MNRLAPGYREVIDRALASLPERIRERVDHAHFLTGISPTFVGLHSYDDAGDGWTYDKLNHATAAWHQFILPVSLRHPTVVLPMPLEEMHSAHRGKVVETVVHELGHILDYALPWRPEVRPVTAYARTNRIEAFAEAFEEYLVGDRESVRALAPEAAAFLDDLAGEPLEVLARG